MLEILPVKEIRQLRQRLAKRIKRIPIPRDELERLVKQNKSKRAIAKFFKVSLLTGKTTA